jgi:hypothetical protein
VPDWFHSARDKSVAAATRERGNFILTSLLRVYLASCPACLTVMESSFVKTWRTEK